MNEDLKMFSQLSSPAYVVYEDKLRDNLRLIKQISQRADVEFILAFKAYALWKTFPIFREYIGATTASSWSEARLAYEEFGAPAHTYSPAYGDSEIADIARFSSHITFNSLSQYSRLKDKVHAANPQTSIGLRINPEYSEIETELYNPCAKGSRFGVLADDMPSRLPADVKGFHCHCHCESGADAFARTLRHIEDKFAGWFRQIEWINFGGGHLVTRKDYDVELLVATLAAFHRSYPWLKVVMEPGSAFAWQTGVLVAKVVDIVENHGIKTAILNVSFTCHMPDCLEMPYMPTVREAETLSESELKAVDDKKFVYRLGGNSCLSGDYMGWWRFRKELHVGDTLVFEDMIHYTTVKTNMFNGVGHPSIMMLHADGSLETLRTYGYEDYKTRMD